MTNLTHGDIIAIDGRRFRIGTTVGCATEHGDDVANAVARGAANGHALVWANPEAVVLASPPIEREPVTLEIRLADEPSIRIDGIAFKVSPAPNRNVSLKGA